MWTSVPSSVIAVRGNNTLSPPLYIDGVMIAQK